ncbi:MAG: acetate kinase [Treponema porcinum]|uniref:acetate kinase n=1 Tax=Treponema TaxID=157 RepID=UPI002351FDA0|nr:MULTISPECIES: acetate kinase [Treponema]MCI5644741.1 acetate kinase [Treponema porcinum]MCI6179110.1 acetate kinase [Treponema porcinum]MCI6322493.1 acetate kinase [Treponema porcinum]MCI6481935.1 acetate kinase [Treponema porcinum]MCI6982919.1 acetate kinase [Treponema porcinum]
MVILTLNCGSSSAKYQVYDWDNKEVLANGVVERVGSEGSGITHKAKGKKTEVLSPCPTHKEAIELIIKEITDPEVGVISDMSVIGAVGHRVLHGGEKFTKSVLVTPEVLDTFRSVIDLGPLHMPANIMGIEAAQKVLPDVPHAAIMDTAWHQTMPDETFQYAIPREWYEKYGARRYGFHGTSFLYTAKRAAVLLGKKPEDTNIIICHIGNGSSMCAVKNGVCYDTTMGITPLEGLVMGTRSGDLDPALPFYIMRKTGMSADEMDKALNKKCGCLGITGRFSDRRDIEVEAAKGDKLCQLCIEMEALRIKKYVGAFMAELGRVDAIVFTAGVGERGPITRFKSLSGLENYGIKIDAQKNEWSFTGNAETCISADDSATKIFVIPTDEELVMTEDAYALMKGTYDVHTNFTYSFQSPDYVNKAREEGLKGDLVKRPHIADIRAFPPKK